MLLDVFKENVSIETFSITFESTQNKHHTEAASRTAQRKVEKMW